MFYLKYAERTRYVYHTYIIRGHSAQKGAKCFKSVEGENEEGEHGGFFPIISNEVHNYKFRSSGLISAPSEWQRFSAKIITIGATGPEGNDIRWHADVDHCVRST